jgi:peptidoglycan/xylan/chitin deacetylase (PgdA/CDA1 family)
MRNFLFHRVHPQRDPLWDPMDPNLFEKCIKKIANNYEVVLLEDYLSQGEFKNHKKVASILFDDGYLDNLDFAEPILSKYGIKASFYVVTDCIDKNIPTWTHVLEHYFQNTQVSKLELPFEFLPQDWRINSLSTYEQRLDFAQKLKPFLKKLQHSEREDVFNHILLQLNDVELPKIMMNWDQIRILKEQGHYIGSHTVSHAMLGTMENEVEIKHELLESAKRIEEELGYFPKTISYPVGSYNNISIKLSKEVGYELGLAVHQDTFSPSNDNLFEISRIELYNEPWWKTKLRISNRLEDLKKIIRYR